MAVTLHQAIEPAIGHAKADHRMDRCWLKGGEGDALHAVLCAAGHCAPGREAHFFGLQFYGAVGRKQEGTDPEQKLETRE